MFDDPACVTSGGVRLTYLPEGRHAVNDSDALDSLVHEGMATVRREMRGKEGVENLSDVSV